MSALILTLSSAIFSPTVTNLSIARFKNWPTRAIDCPKLLLDLGFEIVETLKY